MKDSLHEEGQEFYWECKNVVQKSGIALLMKKKK